MRTPQARHARVGAGRQRAVSRPRGAAGGGSWLPSPLVEGGHRVHRRHLFWRDALVLCQVAPLGPGLAYAVWRPRLALAAFHHRVAPVVGTGGAAAEFGKFVMANSPKRSIAGATASQPMNSRPRRRAACSTPKPPAAGSITKSPGSVTAAISRSIRPTGLACG